MSKESDELINSMWYFDKKLNLSQVTYQEAYEKQISSIVNIKKEDLFFKSS